jgi:hypothetical protein
MKVLQGVFSMTKSKLSMTAVAFALATLASAAHAGTASQNVSNYGNIAPFQPAEVSAMNVSGYGNIAPFKSAETASPNVSSYGNIAPF